MKIKSIEAVKPRKVYAIRTSTGTFIADGLAHHNCYGCNVGKSGNYLDYYYFMERELGSKEAVDDLVIAYKQKEVKYKQHDYEELEDLYIQKYKDLLT